MTLLVQLCLNQQPGTVDAMQPHAKAFREASSRDNVKSSAQETLSGLNGAHPGARILKRSD